MVDYENVLSESDREKRIEIILIDAYGEDEQDIAFCCYLEDYLSFPFEARIRNLSSSASFIVLGFSSVVPHLIVCDINLNETKSKMPITEIEPVDKHSSNNMIIDDYLHFLSLYMNVYNMSFK